MQHQMNSPLSARFQQQLCGGGLPSNTTTTCSRQNLSLQSNLTQYADDFGISMLESILSQMYQIVETTYSKNYNSTTPRAAALTVDSTHRYGFKVNWTAITILVLVFACLVLLLLGVQAWKHFQAHCTETEESASSSLVWPDLFDPLKLIDYSVNKSGSIPHIKGYITDPSLPLPVHLP